jgi:hypothetical protein
MSVQMFPWWGWILIAAGLWFVQMILSVFADSDPAENKHTVFFYCMRGLVIAAMALSTLIGVVRFVKWVWNS